MPVVHRESRAERQAFDAEGAPGPVLVVEQLDYTYSDGRQALRGVSLQVERGEKVALVGPNGAGKSTLMLHLNGILGCDGEVTVAGIPVQRPNLAAVRAIVGLVFQNPDDQLFSPTVFEDVAFGPLHMGLDEGEVERRVADALARVGLSDYAHRLSHHLSAGEKKRAAIATVLAMEPSILVLDEPSAGLDPRSRRQLMALLEALPITMLVASHDMRLVAELFRRVIIMDEGRVVADGPTRDLFGNVELLEAHGLEQP